MQQPVPHQLPPPMMHRSLLPMNPPLMPHPMIHNQQPLPIPRSSMIPPRSMQPLSTLPMPIPIPPMTNIIHRQQILPMTAHTQHPMMPPPMVHPQQSQIPIHQPILGQLPIPQPQISRPPQTLPFNPLINNTLLIQRAQLIQNIRQATILRALAARNIQTENAMKNIQKVNAAINIPINTSILPSTISKPPHIIQCEGVLLFIGKLCAQITDKFFTKLLNACGSVLKWNRMKDTFGFAKFETAEGALRCMTLIGGLQIYGQILVVNAPEKAKQMIAEYKRNKEIQEKQQLLTAGDVNKTVDAVAAAITKELKVNDEQKNKCIPVQPQILQSTENKTGGSTNESSFVSVSVTVDDIKMKNEKKEETVERKLKLKVAKDTKNTDIIMSETNANTGNKQKSVEHKSLSKSKSHHKKRNRDEYERDRDRHRHRTREQQKTRKEQVYGRRKERHNSHSYRSRSRSRSRSHKRYKYRSKDERRDTHTHHRRHHHRNEDEYHYRNNSKEKQMHSHQNKKKHAIDPINSALREQKYAEGLQKVLSSATSKRDEVTLVFLQKIIEDQYTINKYDPKVPKVDKKISPNAMNTTVNERKSSHSHHRHSKKKKKKKRKNESSDKSGNGISLSFGFKSVEMNTNVKKNVSGGNSNSMHAELNGVFEKFDESVVGGGGNEEQIENENENIVTPDSESDSELSSDNSKNVLVGDRVKRSDIRSTRDIIGLIPKENKRLFDFVLDWSVVDSAGIIDRIMKKWLNDRFCEYLGQEEEDLVKFVIKLLSKHQSGRQIITQLRMVLDKDTEQFVVKMWRRLVFETLKVIYTL